ncbi:membrane fusion protein, multidrug efflux system [Dyadobacter sp. SG02]|uniref:efflux RND transporter periplasmic adaptor subunit n=1 Tax=Dyadobacter sp. SG02 TaxID=1855291 RepID=UPI0008D7BCC7|nr:efflux RND transporter periplasmic adaptor subunit [Dyadobacter sp. SG02]SEI51854.1 membrane fusion protein, multidrug efflux system [Dyadobacter sp. SG02]
MKKIPVYFSSLIILLVSGCSSEPEQSPQTGPAPAFEVLAVDAGEATIFSEYPAKLEGLADVEVRSQVAGILQRILVTEGAYVKEGTPLFQVDPRQYTEAYNNAQGELLAAKAAVTTARLELEKLTPLVENKVLSGFQLKIAQSAYDAAQARVKQAEAQAGSARITLGYTTVKAPVTGYIGRIFKKTGSLVSPNDAEQITYISDNRSVHAYFTIGEGDFMKFRQALEGKSIGEKLANAPAAKLVLAGDVDYEHPGKLDMIDAAFDKNTGAIALRATFPNAQGLLRSGNTGKVKLGFKQSNVISIPQAATIEIQDKTFVYTIGDSSKVRKVPLAISAAVGNRYVVSSGLKAGDRIVLKGMDALKEGMVITPKAPVADLVQN